MATQITDKQITLFFWEAKELPCHNKASSLLGDLSAYGVSRCVKMNQGWKRVSYEFDIYLNGNFRIVLVVELSTDFTLKEIEWNVIRLWGECRILTSDDDETLHTWKKEILPIYPFEHATYSAMRFLEALRKALLTR